MACVLIRSNTVISLFIQGLHLTIRYSTVYYQEFDFLLFWYYPWDMCLEVSWLVRVYFKISSNTNRTLLIVLKRFYTQGSIWQYLQYIPVFIHNLLS